MVQECPPQHIEIISKPSWKYTGIRRRSSTTRLSLLRTYTTGLEILMTLLPWLCCVARIFQPHCWKKDVMLSHSNHQSLVLSVTTGVCSKWPHNCDKNWRRNPVGFTIHIETLIYVNTKSDVLWCNVMIFCIGMFLINMQRTMIADKHIGKSQAKNSLQQFSRTASCETMILKISWISLQPA